MVFQCIAGAKTQILGSRGLSRVKYHYIISSCVMLLCSYKNAHWGLMRWHKHSFSITQQFITSTGKGFHKSLLKSWSVSQIIHFHDNDKAGGLYSNPWKTQITCTTFHISFVAHQENKYNIITYSNKLSLLLSLCTLHNYWCCQKHHYRWVNEVVLVLHAA